MRKKEECSKTFFLFFKMILTHLSTRCLSYLMFYLNMGILRLQHLPMSPPSMLTTTQHSSRRLMVSISSKMMFLAIWTVVLLYFISLCSLLHTFISFVTFFYFKMLKLFFIHTSKNSANVKERTTP